MCLIVKQSFAVVAPTNVTRDVSSNVCLEKEIAIYVVKSTPIHATLIVPNLYLGLDLEFPGYSYVQFNWGSEDYYRAGNDIIALILASPQAMLTESKGAVLIDPIHEAHIGQIGNYLPMVKIMIDETELKKLNRILSNFIAWDSSGKLALLANAPDFGPYPQEAKFYKSTVPYKGMNFTCNGMVARVLSKTVSSFGQFESKLVGPLMNYLKSLTHKNSCINQVGRPI